MADDFEEFVWRRTSDNLLDPDTLVPEFRRHFATGGGDTVREMAKLRREINDYRAKQMCLLEQRGRDVIDQDLLELQIGPLKALCDEKERALRVFEEQQRREDDMLEDERRVVERCREFSDSLDDLDGKGKRAVLSAFGVQVQASKDDLRITLSVSPECTTIGQTLA